MTNNNTEHSVFYAARQAIKRHATGGNILIITTILAFIIANISAINTAYFDFWTQPMRLQIGDFNILSHGDQPMTLLDFINDALMAIFFFSIGLEIKREVLVGELSSIRQALLPILGACGGMIIPVVIFFLTADGADYTRGSAIPMATDIAFSLGVLSMFGKRVPMSLKIFLTTLAVVDDLGGIIVIAAFYSGHIDYTPLLISAALLLLLLMGSRMHIKSKVFYLGIGAIVWYLFLNSGIHATIAGVLVAFCVPATPVFAPQKYIRAIRRSLSALSDDDTDHLDKRTILTPEQMNSLKEIESASDKVISPLQELEDHLHPLVNYFIIPLFAFANAGILLGDVDPATIFQGVSLSVILGLVIGKFLGIFTFSFLTIKLHLAPKPRNASWRMLAAVCMLGGIGFTVSMFIANLSFPGADPHHVALLDHAKLGIVVGSILSGIIGYIWLNHVLPHHDADNPDADVTTDNH